MNYHQSLNQLSVQSKERYTKVACSKEHYVPFRETDQSPKKLSVRFVHVCVCCVFVLVPEAYLVIHPRFHLEK